MDRVRQSAPQLARITPYDPKYIPAEAYMSANENPHDVDEDVRRAIERRIKNVELNRYPDPLANELRDAIAEANGLDRDWVLIGNGGDGLLFDTALAWGGPGRTFLNMPPTFSVYEANARLLNTTVLEVPRDRENEYAIDEERVLELMSGPTSEVDFTIISNPNNPTGLMTSFEFLEKLLASTDALVMVDEAYFEFSRQTMRPHLEAHKNLVILRTFSKAFSLAGVRLGYILGHPEVIDEYQKVRQPYSVDAVSQAIGSVVYEHRSTFVPAIDEIISERDRMYEALRVIPGVIPYKSQSNWLLFKMADAGQAWEALYEAGILVRDFSSAPGLEGTLRVSVGTKEQNDRFLLCLRDFALRKQED